MSKNMFDLFNEFDFFNEKAFSDFNDLIFSCSEERLRQKMNNSHPKNYEISCNKKENDICKEETNEDKEYNSDVNTERGKEDGSIEKCSHPESLEVKCCCDNCENDTSLNDCNISSFDGCSVKVPDDFIDLFDKSKENGDFFEASMNILKGDRDKISINCDDRNRTLNIKYLESENVDDEYNYACFQKAVYVPEGYDIFKGSAEIVGDKVVVKFPKIKKTNNNIEIKIK